VELVITPSKKKRARASETKEVTVLPYLLKSIERSVGDRNRNEPLGQGGKIPEKNGGVKYRGTKRENKE